MESSELHGVGVHGAKNQLFRELHKLIRHIPIDVFNDEEQRQNLIQAVQKRLMKRLI